MRFHTCTMDPSPDDSLRKASAVCKAPAACLAERRARITGLVALFVRAVVAELPIPVAPPALDAAADEDRAGVREAGRDGNGASAKVDTAINCDFNIRVGHVLYRNKL